MPQGGGVPGTNNSRKTGLIFHVYNMKTRKRKWLWVGPLLIVLAGIVNLLNPSLPPALKNLWLILMPVALAITLFGINLHFQTGCGKFNTVLQGTQPCPKCNSLEVQRVRFVWWGGFVGPQLLHIGKCKDCGNQFNYKTGKKNTISIIIYVLAVNGFFNTCVFCLRPQDRR